MATGKHVIEMSEAEQERAIQTARDLAAEFDKVGAEADEKNEFPFSLVPLYKDAGLPGISVPKKYGGGGADIWTLARISYELAWYLWNDFGSKGEAVDLVGHSMGGIVIAYALQQIAAH